MTEKAYTGGCLCGAVRYEAREAPLRVNHCHCTDCRRASGAPFMTWGTFPRNAVTFTKGEPRTFKSSERAERLFCNTCGTQLVWAPVADTSLIDLSVGSMDEPERVQPTDHYFTRSRISWLHVDDGLPGHEKLAD